MMKRETGREMQLGEQQKAMGKELGEQKACYIRRLNPPVVWCCKSIVDKAMAHQTH